MNVKNCPECGNIFVDIGFRLCESCLKIENEQFQKVKSFLQKNTGVTVDMIAEGTGVSRQQILRFIKAGRLSGSINKLSDPALLCERCEKPILEGRLCLKCQAELTRKFKAPSKKEEEKSTTKIRFLKRE
ncbi:MAG: MerR family transcriptional regulator [Firmicutes bacterium]|nr:MerR family transcriptional regulator [Bacillota bacterium]MDD4263111.1 MerR family transcriptional regulator [Bacillota bacterium]MDD4693233.1 MerR family transcriptional regulator [Bacillota bacterium]